MKTLRIAVVLCALLPPWTASASTLLPSPPPASTQYGSCALTLAVKPAKPAKDAKAGKRAAAPHKPRKQVDINLIYDPCYMEDAERQVDEARNDGLSVVQRLELYDDAMEWNHRRSGTAKPELWWLIARPSGPHYGADDGRRYTDQFAPPAALLPPFSHAERQPGLEQGQALPAVPEPPVYGLWLAGLALLAVAVRRRTQRR